MPLSSTNDGQLKNFSVLIQNDHYLDIVLLVEFIEDSADRECFGQSKNSSPRTPTGDESSKSKISLIKMTSNFVHAK